MKYKPLDYKLCQMNKKRIGNRSFYLMVYAVCAMHQSILFSAVIGIKSFYFLPFRESLPMHRFLRSVWI